MTIFDYFNKRGIQTADTGFYREIEKWKSWYNANVRGFSQYKVYNGQGMAVRRRRKSLGMAKMVCEDIADLLMNERVQIVIADQPTAAYIEQVLQDNNFYVMANEYQERKAYSGTVAYIPYLEDTVLDNDGNPVSGRIGIDFVSAANIFPLSWSNNRITECAFAFPQTYNRRKYIQIQYHRKDGNGLYVIENEVIECGTGGDAWNTLTPAEWKQVKPFENLAVSVMTNSDKPQFVIDRLNMVNNADNDESNPMGIAIFANAIDILKKLDTEYDSYSNEFELGRKRIFVAPEMLKNTDGSPAFDPEDTVFYSLPDNYAEKGDGLIHEVNMDLRAEQHSRAINDDLNYLSLKCGFGTQRYRFESGNVKTATEVISENSDMYRRLVKHEIILDDAIKEMLRIIIRLANALGEGLDENTDITVDFDDSIIEDRDAERNSDRNDVNLGAMPLWEYRMKWYGENEETAKSMVNMQEVDFE